jgi:hypothetical protein
MKPVAVAKDPSTLPRFFEVLLVRFGDCFDDREGTAMKRLMGGTGIALAAMIAMAGPAFADDCTNASRNAHAPGAGAQLIIDTNSGNIEWASAGVQQRIDRGLIDPSTGAGFHGLIGLDFNSDGVVDVTTYIVGPNGALPETAQNNGSPCHGVTSIETYLSQCLPA